MGQVHEVGNYSGKVLQAIEHHQIAIQYGTCTNMQYVHIKHATWNMFKPCWNPKFSQKLQKTRKSFVL